MFGVMAKLTSVSSIAGQEETWFWQAAKGKALKWIEVKRTQNEAGEHTSE